MKRQILTISILLCLAGCQDPKPVQQPLLEKEAPSIIYDIPLNQELQEYTLEVCKEFDFARPEIIFAMMKTESDFNTEAISITSDYGLMQINPVNLGWLNTQIGITDLLDPKQNIKAGIYMIDQLMDKYQSMPMALMAYNLGEYGALEYWNAGIFHSDYSDSVMTNLQEINRCQ